MTPWHSLPNLALHGCNRPVAELLNAPRITERSARLREQAEGLATEGLLITPGEFPPILDNNGQTAVSSRRAAFKSGLINARTKPTRHACAMHITIRRLTAGAHRKSFVISRDKGRFSDRPSAYIRVAFPREQRKHGAARR